MRPAFLAILATLTLAPHQAAAQTLAETSGASPAPDILEGPAVIIDGNTLEVAGERVRLFGIDAPEIGTPEGRRARGALDDLVSGAPVSCPPLDRDRYRRVIARCATAAVPDLGWALLAQGWAIVYGRFTAGSEVAQAYDAAELAARRAGLGLWAPPAVAGANDIRATWWDRLANDPASLATVVAAFVGFLGGAVISHLLTMWRDYRRRKREVRALAAALAAELLAARRMCRAQLKRLSLVEKSSTDTRWKVKIAQFALWHPVEAPVFHANASKIGHLPPALAAKVSRSYADLHELRRLDELADADEVVVKSLLDELGDAISTAIDRIDDLIPGLVEEAGTPIPDPPEVDPDHGARAAEEGG